MSTRLLLALLGSTVISVAQTPPVLPTVASGNIPSYPALARIGQIEGDVYLRVTTDGERVASVTVESGPPLLTKAAVENVRTWAFEPHAPTTFSTVFSYSLHKEWVSGSCDPDRPDNGTVTLQLPSQVSIRSRLRIADCPAPVDVDRTRVFLTECSIDGSPVQCGRLTIALRSSGRKVTPSRFKDSEQAQGFLVPAAFRTLKDFEVVVKTGSGTFAIPKLDVGFLKGEWHVGVDHAPFKEGTPISYDTLKAPPSIHCIGYIVFEGEPGVVAFRMCK